MKNRLVLIFPGAGYHDDKPLLYYGKKSAKKAGYDILVMDYGNITFNIDYLYDYVDKAIQNLLEKELKLDEYIEIISIEKSVGTLIAGKLYSLLGLNPKRIVLTPLNESIKWLKQGDIVISGLEDQLFCAESRKKIDLMGIKGYYYESANHSLEVEGNILLSIEILHQVVSIYEIIMGGK